MRQFDKLGMRHNNHLSHNKNYDLIIIYTYEKMTCLERVDKLVMGTPSDVRAILILLAEVK